MSVRVMSAVWDIDLPAFEKLVLLALADCANDEGLAWPSIATLKRKTGASERTIQRAIHSVENAGHLTRDTVPGKGCRYQIHPRHSDTPVTVTPPSERHPTPVTVTPHPRHSDTQSVIEPSMNHSSGDKSPSPRARAREGSARAGTDPFPKPSGVDDQVWQDFLVNRKRKRCANTATAHRRLLADIDRLTDDEWPPGRLIEHAAARGWAGIYDPRENRHDQREIRTASPPHTPSGREIGRTEAAARDLLADLAVRGRP